MGNYDYYREIWEVQRAILKRITKMLNCDPTYTDTTFTTPWLDTKTGKEVTPIPKVFLDAFEE